MLCTALLLQVIKKPSLLSKKIKMKYQFNCNAKTYIKKGLNTFF